MTKGGKEPEYETKMHSLQEGAIDVYKGFMALSSDRLFFEIFKEMGKDHPVWKIPISNSQIT